MKSHGSMNRIYRLVWNAALNLWVAVAENAKGSGKSSGRTAAAVLTTLALLTPQAYGADAANAAVSVGSGNVTTTGTTTTINQASQRLAIDWTSLSTRANEALVFNQPNAQAIALNRITGSSPSELLGSLTANGQVFILNPNGVLFGAGSQVNVGGLVASTLSMSNADFMAGSNVFTKDANSAGTVINRGTLTAADGGYIALLAPQVRNEGVISATLGTALLAAGNKVTLNLNNGSLLGYSIDQGALNALADNQQLIQANGGQVLMSAKAADALSMAVVNNTGVIEAKTLQNQSGRILLMGDMASGQVNVAGKLDASAPNGGDGGFIETSAAHVKVADGAVITTQASSGKTGTWLVDPQDFTVATSGGDISGATLSANLVSTNVSLQSSAGLASGSGDINVNDNVSLVANTLTMTAARDININAVVTVGGVSTLEMNTGNANGADAGVAGGAVKVGFNPDGTFKGRVDFPGRSGTGILQINGSDYTVINALGSEGSYTATDLQGMAGNYSVNYALGANIDASATSGWNGGLGFSPVYMQGNFDGLGHTVTNLTINRPNDSYIGMFGQAYGALGNVGLVGASITGQSYVGALAGYNGGNTITNSYATGNVSGNSSVGGLLGYLYNGQINNSYSAAQVTGVEYNSSYSYSGYYYYYGNYSYSGSNSDGSSSIGGLVGNADNTTIANSYSTGDVLGTSSVGGLAGSFNSGRISNSYSSARVQGVSHLNHYDYQYSYQYYYGSSSYSQDYTQAGEHIGGLVGNMNSATIDNSQATGVVSGNTNVGGLVGSAYSSAITNSFSAGRVDGLSYLNVQAYSNSGGYNYSYSNTQGSSYVGGLVGQNYYGSIATSQATGNVSGNNSVGGLVGYAYSSAITDSSSTGRVEGLSYVNENISRDSNGNITSSSSSIQGSSSIGGLVGQMDSVTVDGSRASGDVSGNYLVGGLAGGANSSSITNSSATGRVDGLNYVNAQTYSDNSGYSSTSSYAQGSSGIGGLVGQAYSVTIDNSLASGDVSGNNSVGGFVGNAYSTNITNSSSTGSVAGLSYVNQQTVSDSNGYNYSYSNTQGSSAVGGLVGSNYSGAINNSFAVGSVTAEGQYTGGLVGNQQYGSIDSSYATGAVTNTSANDNDKGTGGLVGQNDSGSITASYATGNVTGPRDTGGLAGRNTNSATITDSYASGTVSGSGSGSIYTTGGLVGYNEGTLTTTYATGEVSGGDNVGGLMGYGGGAISNSYAIGNVAGGNYVGGLAGVSYGAIDASYATGNVSGANLVGGLAGSANNTVSSSYATGAVTASGDFVGGLLGESLTDVSNSYATGAVTAQNRVGGLVGQMNGSQISNSYATGAVTGANQVGGLLGWINGGNVVNTYATGAVSGSAEVGGLVGYAGGTVSSSYWDAGTSGQSTGIGAGNNTGATGKATVEMKQLATFAGWDIDSTGGTGKVWRIYEGNTNPLLRSFLTGITLADTSTTYNGSTQTGTVVPTVGALSGTAASGRNAGTYDNAYSNQQGYDISGGTLTIDQAALTISTSDVTKVYDAGLAAAGTAIAGGGTSLLGTDSLSGGSFAFTDKNAGTGKTVTTSGVSVNDGNSGGNYVITYADNTTSSISKRALAVTAAAASKTYDGNTVAAITLADNRVAGDVLTLTDTAANFANKNVGTAKAVSVTGINVAGTDSGNYTFNTTAATTANITPKPLTVTANNDSKAFDNKSYSGGNGAVFNGLVTGDTVADVTGSLVFSGSSQGAVGLGRYVITPGGLSGNYAPTYLNGELSITANSQSIAALGGTALVSAYESVLQNESAPAKPRAPQTPETTERQRGNSLVDVVNCGVLMPQGVNVSACQ